MYWLDVAILALLGFGAGLGFWSGLLWQVARLASLGLSVYATIVLNEPATRLLHEQIAPDADTNLLRAAAYIGVFLAVYIALFTLTRMLHETIKATKLDFLDRIAGALLGAAKVALVLAPLCAALAYVALPITEEWMHRSALAPVFARAVEQAVVLIPEAYRNQARDSMQHVRALAQGNPAEHALDAIERELAPAKAP
jgi:membrane protein required for colicin V production